MKEKNRKKNRFMGATLMCFFLIISFDFNTSQLNWFWTGSETVPIVLALATIIFGILWFFDYRKYQITNK